MNEFDDIDRILDEAFTERPSVLSRPSLRDVKQRARRHQRQRSAGVLSACAIVGVGGVAVLATRSPANQTSAGEGDTLNSIFCDSTTTNVVYDSSTVPSNTLPDITVTFTGTNYVLQSGDNPSSVAQQFAVTLDALNAANADTPDYYLFYVGLEIKIPDVPVLTATTLPGITDMTVLIYDSSGAAVGSIPIGGQYTLQSGDYRASVAEMFQITVAELDAVNRDVPGYEEMLVGTKINIPFASQAPATTDTTVVEPTAWTTTTMAVAPTYYRIQTVYLIQASDTPEAVAAEYGVTVSELDEANVNNPGYTEWAIGTLIQIPMPGALTTTKLTEINDETSNCVPGPASTMPGGEQTTTSILLTATTIEITKIGTVVQVANCSNQEGVARLMSNQLAEEGFTMAEPETCTIDLPVTKILYNPDDPAAFAVANSLAIYLSYAVVEASGPVIPTLTTGTWAPGSSVLVLLGDDLAGKTLAQIAAEGNPTTTTDYSADAGATVTTCVVPPQMTAAPPATTTSIAGSC